MTDSTVHAATHPSGHPNKTAVNEENPIFGRPADPIPEVSLQQAAVVQSEKTPRETVQSPLINEDVASPTTIGEESVVENTEELPEQSAEEVAAVQEAESSQDSSPSAEDLDASAAENTAKEETAGEAPSSELTPAEQEDAAGKEGVEPVPEEKEEDEDEDFDEDEDEDAPQDSEPAEASADPIPA